ncbi:MAG: hypothetical protein WC243_01505 [Patescibacteria group bacterium]|jgi:hypothetical protein
MEEIKQEQAGELSANNDQQVSPEVQQKIESVKRSGAKKRKFLFVLTLILVLSLLGLFSWVRFSQRQITPRKVGEETEQETPETPQTSESAVEEYKTYVNEKQRFQFTYPIELNFEQLIVFSEEPTHYRVVYTGGLQETPVEKEEDLVDGYIFRVAVHDNVTTPLADLVKMKKEKFMRDCPESAEISAESSVTVHGEKGYLFTAENCKQNYIVQMVSYYGKVYEIVQVYKGDVGFKLSYKGRMDEIMGTYEFIRDKAPVDPDGLEAYTNQEYGFSFRHPHLNSTCCTISGPTGKDIAYLGTLAEMEGSTTNFKGKVNGIALFIDRNSELMSFEDYVKVQKEKLVQEYRVILSRNPKPEEEEIILDGKTAYYLRDYAWWGDAILVPMDEEFHLRVLIIAMTETEEGLFEESFDKILSTFKFLPQQ